MNARQYLDSGAKGGSRMLDLFMAREKRQRPQIRRGSPEWS